MARVAAWVGSVDDPPFASSLREATVTAVASWHHAISTQPFGELRARLGRFLFKTVARLVKRFARLRNLPLRATHEHLAWLQAHAPPVS